MPAIDNLTHEGEAIRARSKDSPWSEAQGFSSSSSVRVRASSQRVVVMP